MHTAKKWLNIYFKNHAVLTPQDFEGICGHFLNIIHKRVKRITDTDSTIQA